MEEDFDMFPVTPEEALRKHKKKIKKIRFPEGAPHLSISTSDTVDVNECSHFGFIFSHDFGQCFLFVDSYSGEDVPDECKDASYSVMSIYAIKGAKPVYVGKENIVLGAGVYASPRSGWSTFSDELIWHGTDGHNGFLEEQWTLWREAAFPEKKSRARMSTGGLTLAQKMKLARRK
jgi:hypothetical protein